MAVAVAAWPVLAVRMAAAIADCSLGAPRKVAVSVVRIFSKFLWIQASRLLNFPSHLNSATLYSPSPWPAVLPY